LSVTVRFRVNGTSRSVGTDPQRRLLDVLREDLQLTGTKYGCGEGQCGACTVHLDGEPVRSCLLSARDIGTKKITTIEGLTADGSHPVQRAWVELDVPQCGYCQAGRIMSAVALLSQKPSPTDAEIADAMNGNLCRCGTYVRIRAAIKKAATGAGSPSAAGAGRGASQEVR